MHLSPGTIIDGKYEIQCSLGAGGMGIVYRAVQRELDRVVAIKFLAEDLGSDQEAYLRFEREAQIISRLHHKSIVGLYAFGKWLGHAYMVMECVVGQSLEARLKEHQPIDPTEALRIIGHVCSALECAHAHGVTHRDIKPSNVLLTESDEVKIIDFGLAKLVEADRTQAQRLTEAGCAVGSVQYMSPEQCTGGNADRRSDIYSVGALLHHCLTGFAPFDGDHSVVLMYKHLNDQNPRLSDFVELPNADSLQAIIDTAMQKDPNARYQTAHELAQDVDLILRGQKPAGRMQSSATNKRVSTPPPSVSRKKNPVVLIAIAAAILSAVGYAAIVIHEPTINLASEIDTTIAELERLEASHPHPLNTEDCANTPENAEIHLKLAEQYHKWIIAGERAGAVPPRAVRERQVHWNRAWYKTTPSLRFDYLKRGKGWIDPTEFRCMAHEVMVSIVELGQNELKVGNTEKGCDYFRTAAFLPDSFFELNPEFYWVRTMSLYYLMLYSSGEPNEKLAKMVVDNAKLQPYTTLASFKNAMGLPLGLSAKGYTRDALELNRFLYERIPSSNRIASGTESHDWLMVLTSLADSYFRCHDRAAAMTIYDRAKQIVDSATTQPIAENYEALALIAHTVDAPDVEHRLRKALVKQGVGDGAIRAKLAAVLVERMVNRGAIREAEGLATDEFQRASKLKGVVAKTAQARLILARSTIAHKKHDSKTRIALLNDYVSQYRDYSTPSELLDAQNTLVFHYLEVKDIERARAWLARATQMAKVMVHPDLDGNVVVTDCLTAQLAARQHDRKTALVHLKKAYLQGKRLLDPVDFRMKAVIETCRQLTGKDQPLDTFQ